MYQDNASYFFWNEAHSSVTEVSDINSDLLHVNANVTIYENKWKIKGNFIIGFEVINKGQLHVSDFHSASLKSYCLPCIWPNSSRFSDFITIKCFCLGFRPFVLCFFVLSDDHFNYYFTSADYPVVPDILIALVPNHSTVNDCSKSA
jgi:hypothetical protein